MEVECDMYNKYLVDLALDMIKTHISKTILLKYLLLKDTVNRTKLQPTARKQSLPTPHPTEG